MGAIHDMVGTPEVGSDAPGEKWREMGGKDFD